MPGLGGFGFDQSNNNSNSSGINGSNNTGINSNVGLDFGSTQSGGSSSSSGSSFNSSASENTVWEPQQEFLQDLYQQSQDAFNGANQGIQNLQPGVSQGVEGAFQQGMQGYGNQMQGGFGQQLQGQVGPNAFTSALKGNIADDANLLKQQNLGSLDARAAASGMSGSTGYGESDGLGRDARPVSG